MAERENPIIIVGGVRYRKDDAARLGLTEDSGTKPAPKKAATKKGAGDGGTVSGGSDGSGDADGAAGDGSPAPLSTRES